MLDRIRCSIGIPKDRGVPSSWLGCLLREGCQVEVGNAMEGKKPATTRTLTRRSTLDAGFCSQRTNPSREASARAARVFEIWRERIESIVLFRFAKRKDSDVTGTEV
jgi:hypothetical protein